MFPKSSKCNLHVYGPSGTRQLYDALWAGSCTRNYSIKVNSKKYVGTIFYSPKSKTILLSTLQNNN